MNNHPLAVLALVGGGALVAAANRNGDTVVHLAAARGFVDVLVLLVHHDPSVANLKAADGSTPLHRAAANGHGLCCNVLLSCGADSKMQDQSGLEPTEIAMLGNHPGTLAVLGGTPDTPSADDRGTLHQAARNGDTSLTRSLIAQGADPGQLDDLGCTPIRLAAETGHTLVLNELVTHAASRAPSMASAMEVVDRAGTDGMTPLLAACANKHMGCVLILLASRLPNLNIALPDGNTALHVAAQEGLPVTVAFLLLAGIDPNRRNAKGQSALDIASLHLHEATIQVRPGAPLALRLPARPAPRAGALVSSVANPHATPLVGPRPRSSGVLIPPSPSPPHFLPWHTCFGSSPSHCDALVSLGGGHRSSAPQTSSSALRRRFCKRRRAFPQPALQRPIQRQTSRRGSLDLPSSPPRARSTGRGSA